MKHILSLFLIAIAFLSCNDWAVRDALEQTTESKLIEFTLISQHYQPLTRGIPREGDDPDIYHSDKIRLISYAYDYQSEWNKPSGMTQYFESGLNKNPETGSWVLADGIKRFYPDEKKLAFFAWASDLEKIPEAEHYMDDQYNRNGLQICHTSSSTPRIYYSVPTNAEKTDKGVVILQPDLLVAKRNIDRNNGKVILEMKHALSCVSFAPVGHIGQQIDYIYISGIYGSGYLDLDQPSIEWVKTGGKNLSFTAGTNQNHLPQDIYPDPKDPNYNVRYLMNPDGYLMMIPQTIGNDAKITIKYTGVPEAVVYDLPHGEWEAGKKYVYTWGTEGIVTYYEIYADGYGLYYYDESGILHNSLRTEQTENGGIIEAGYGVFAINTSPSTIQWGNSLPVSNVNIHPDITANISGQTFYLYPVSQTAAEGKSGPFRLSPSLTPNTIYYNGVAAHGYCLPHFAKGVYRTASIITGHAIRTPQQLINIGFLIGDQDINSGTNSTRGCLFTQEHNLDFADIHRSIGGARSFPRGIVYDQITPTTSTPNFHGEYNGSFKAINNLNISGSADVSGRNVIGLFEYAGASAIIRNLRITNSCSFNYTATAGYSGTTIGIGAFVGRNAGRLEKLDNRANISAVNYRNAGGIAGYTIYQESSRILDCINSGNISSFSSAGGIVGWADASYFNQNYQESVLIQDCRNYGNISNTASNVSSYINGTGGIAGTATAGFGNIIIERCVNYGSVSGYKCVGGITGVLSSKASPGTGRYAGQVYAGEGIIRSCAHYGERGGNIIGSGISPNSIGGIVGQMYKDPTSLDNPFNPQITLLENILFVSNNSPPITPIALNNSNVGGIAGNTDAISEIRNVVYLAIAPHRIFNQTDYLYPVIGSDYDAKLDSYYYVLSTGSYNSLPTRYGRSIMLPTSGFAAIDCASYSSTYIPDPNTIGMFLPNEYWNADSSCPYPLLKGIPEPNKWPIAEAP